MSELSRMKKFEDLRESIQNDREGDTHSEALTPFAQRLSRIDATFKTPREQISSLPHKSLHGKKDIRFDSTTVGSSMGFNNDYLEDFIEEVKNYNIKKGYRSHEDTGSNIFSQAHKEIKSNPVEHKPLKPKPFFSQNRFLASEEESLSAEELSLTNEIKQVIISDPEPIETFPSPMPFTQPETSQEDLQSVREATQKIRIQLDEYEKELNGVNINVSKSNRLLNFVVVGMVMVLILMLGMAVYWVLIARGFIK
jgi:hypothetical protein